MSTNITLAHLSESSEPSSKRGSSHSQRHESFAPRSISNHTSPTKISLSLPSLKKSWEQSYGSFQTSTQNQCLHMHYHPWCNDCQTLMEWEPLPPISPKCKPLMSRMRFHVTDRQQSASRRHARKNGSRTRMALQKQ